MRSLTKKYIFEQKLKGEEIIIWVEQYDDPKKNWLTDLNLLEECGIVTPIINDFRTVLYDLVVFYPADEQHPDGRKHWLDAGIMLSFKLPHSYVTS